jgi:hypothetical protein
VASPALSMRTNELVKKPSIKVSLSNTPDSFNHCSTGWNPGRLYGKIFFSKLALELTLKKSSKTAELTL